MTVRAGTTYRHLFHVAGTDVVGEPGGLSTHPLRIHGNHNFFCSLGPCRRLKTCLQEKTVIFHVYYIKIKTAYMHLKNCAFLGGSDIAYLKISPTFVLFGHVMRCFLQQLSLLSILCTSKCIHYLILYFSC